MSDDEGSYEYDDDADEDMEDNFEYTDEEEEADDAEVALENGELILLGVMRMHHEQL